MANKREIVKICDHAIIECDHNLNLFQIFDLKIRLFLG